MNPTLWGPALWQALFVAAWGCDRAGLPILLHLIRDLLPHMIPCEKCRKHFGATLRHADQKMEKTPVNTAERAFEWLWHMKDFVNRKLGMKSIAFQSLTERYAFQVGLLDEVAFSDAMVLVALHAQQQQLQDVFTRWCHAWASLLPPLSASLWRAQKPIVASAVRMARDARAARGLPVLPRSHYERMAHA